MMPHPAPEVVCSFLQAKLPATLPAMRAPDIRWIQRFDNFKRAFAQLSQAAALADQRSLSDLERQGLIQAFEFTHELAWNTLKDFLNARGTSTQLYGSRDAKLGQRNLHPSVGEHTHQPVSLIAHGNRLNSFAPLR